MIEIEYDVAWYLEGLLNDGKTWLITIDPLPFTIGRKEGCDLSISTRSISRRHAEILQQESCLWLRDLGSKNGTFVNGRRVSGLEQLRTGDVVQFGNVQFRVFSRGQEVEEKMEETSTSLNLIPLQLPYCEPEFKSLLDKKAVTPLFQPIVRIDNGSLLGYEILSRGRLEGLPTRPLELFSLAEPLGYEAKLSRLFWQQGLLEGARLPGSPHLFINIHPAETAQPGLIESLESIRTTWPSLPITVELSEKAVTDLVRMKRLRVELQNLNIYLAYDDFGAGQARFLELIEVPPHYLKFDASLIHQIHTRHKRLLQMVETLVKMACDLGITPLAEGIECEEEREVCKRIGFQYAQGYLFGKPVHASEI
jgi:EAL domain-containing protein (putative c-di-GMP-specific phosphodiesterase class I)